MLASYVSANLRYVECQRFLHKNNAEAGDDCWSPVKSLSAAARHDKPICLSPSDDSTVLTEEGGSFRYRGTRDEGASQGLRRPRFGTCPRIADREEQSDVLPLRRVPGSWTRCTPRRRAGEAIGGEGAVGVAASALYPDLVSFLSHVSFLIPGATYQLPAA